MEAMQSMNNIVFGLNDIVEMKKQHPCGTNRWQVIRLGADIKIKCCHSTYWTLLKRCLMYSLITIPKKKADIGNK